MQLLLKMLIIYLMIDVFMIGWFMEQFQQKVQFKKKRSAIVLTNHLLLHFSSIFRALCVCFDHENWKIFPLRREEFYTFTFLDMQFFHLKLSCIR